MYKIPKDLVTEITKGDDEYAWIVVLGSGHFRANVVVLFENDVFVNDIEWIGWLPGLGAITPETAEMPIQVKLVSMKQPV